MLIIRRGTLFFLVCALSSFILANLAEHSFIASVDMHLDEIALAEAGAAFILLIVALLQSEKSVFFFDRATQLVSWRKLIFSKEKVSIEPPMLPAPFLRTRWGTGQRALKKTSARDTDRKFH